MNTEIANAVNAARDKAQYDTRVKRVLAHKMILAHILISTVDEFKGMSPEDVAACIEGEPKIGVVPVEPGLTNVEMMDKSGQAAIRESDTAGSIREEKADQEQAATGGTDAPDPTRAERTDMTGYAVSGQATAGGTDVSDPTRAERTDMTGYAMAEQATAGGTDAASQTRNEKSARAGQRIIGLNTENSEVNEGLIRFDIIFYVRMRDGLSQIIVNVECQKDEPSAYKILNRAIFYVSRMVSSQKERDFVNTNYDDIKQVFSIWICMDMDYNCMSHIHLTKDEMLKPHDWKGNLDLLNIVMIGVTNDIPERGENYELHRLIGTLLSDKLQEQEKLEILEQEYNIPVNNDYREEVTTMCNLSDGIEERGAERAREAIILNMYNKGYTLEQIAEVTDVSEEAIEEIIREKDLLLV